ncbi:uncharacterized protein, YhcH/YjgK/YiaL family [Sphaerochaeta pleomorpha str. Grapes]|uniref:Uncharacterized protein, YhcH/YjgK/YiaL family n=1 Tax=Sphaerochaeta pleomorpha (strain ATCC BAA-1885 / DSM 22778 / Grapes) TaxID=158190 RepID=G8QVH5_SPHPG|nr:YhcH/YjgK/YiaL family protein [Sphaerochaeta pleomorpha]AEV28208.1 uncharacterized protein, YhcH/YjgK/YiaL family [Sphaerochaeta pleomorpha str. Grapes]
MIYDTISNLEKYCPLVPQLKTVITSINKENFTAKDIGEYKTRSKNIRYSISHAQSPIKNSLFEMHKEETIVQIILEGKELLALTWREHAKGLPYDKDHDVVLLEGDPTAVIHAEKGHFIIFFPGEPFKEGLGENYTKAIFKLRD